MKLNKSCFIQSFRLDRNFLYVMLVDFLYYCGLYAVLLFLISGKLLYHISMLKNIIGNYNAGAFDALQQQFAHTQTAVILYSLLSLAAIVLLYAIFKGIEWQIIIKNHISIKSIISYFSQYFLRLIIATLAIIIIFVVIFYLSFALMKQSIYPFFIIFIEIPVFIHYSGILFPMLIIKKKLWGAIKASMAVAFAKIYRFFLPYLLMICVVIVLILVAIALSYLPRSLFGLSLLLLFIAYTSYFKYYLVRVIRKVM